MSERQSNAESLRQEIEVVIKRWEDESDLTVGEVVQALEFTKHHYLTALFMQGREKKEEPEEE